LLIIFHRFLLCFRSGRLKLRSRAILRTTLRYRQSCVKDAAFVELHESWEDAGNVSEFGWRWQINAADISRPIACCVQRSLTSERTATRRFASSHRVVAEPGEQATTDGTHRPTSDFNYSQ